MDLGFLSFVMRLYVDVFGADLLRYVLGAGGVYLTLNLALAHRLAAQTIHNGPVPRRQLVQEVLASLRTVVIFAAVGTSIGLMSRAGTIDIYTDVAERGWLYLTLSTVLLIVAHDAWFYWTHRALHTRLLFRRFHRLHHKSHAPTPFTSYSFDVGEAFVNAAFLPLILLVLPAHPIALFLFVTHMMARNALGHCGIEIFPAWPDGRPVFGWLASVTHHDLHHAQGRWNMGFYFTWWDRWMGTEHPEYRSAFARVAPRVSVGRVRAIGVILVVALALLAARAEAYDLHGRYVTPGMGAIIAFEPCPDAAQLVCARLHWVWEAEQMPHAAIGDVIASRLTFDGTAWQGRMINPENGRTFRGTIRQAGPGELTVRGCAGPFCLRQTWYAVTVLRRALSDH